MTSYQKVFDGITCYGDTFINTEERVAAGNAWYMKNGSVVPSEEEALSFVGEMFSPVKPVGSTTAVPKGTIKTFSSSSSYGFKTSNSATTDSFSENTEKSIGRKGLVMNVSRNDLEGEVSGGMDPEESRFLESATTDSFSENTEKSIRRKGLVMNVSRKDLEGDVSGEMDPTESRFLDNPKAFLKSLGNVDGISSDINRMKKDISLEDEIKQCQTVNSTIGNLSSAFDAIDIGDDDDDTVDIQDAFKTKLKKYIVDNHGSHKGVVLALVPSKNDLKIMGKNIDNKAMLRGHVGLPLKPTKKANVGNITAVVLRTDNEKEYRLIPNKPGASNPFALVGSRLAGTRQIANVEPKETIPGFKGVIKFCYLA
jgi:hypothetical protein